MFAQRARLAVFSRSEKATINLQRAARVALLSRIFPFSRMDLTAFIAGRPTPIGTTDLDDYHLPFLDFAKAAYRRIWCFAQPAALTAALRFSGLRHHRPGLDNAHRTLDRNNS